MSSRQLKTWLVSFDIRDAKRIRRVHRILKRDGMALQYSAFSVRADDLQILSLLTQISDVIKSEDDVRAYHIPDQCAVWSFGQGVLPDGIHLTPPQVIGLFSDRSSVRLFETQEALPTDS